MLSNIQIGKKVGSGETRRFHICLIFPQKDNLGKFTREFGKEQMWLWKSWRMHQKWTHSRKNCKRCGMTFSWMLVYQRGKLTLNCSKVRHPNCVAFFVSYLLLLSLLLLILILLYITNCFTTNTMIFHDIVVECLIIDNMHCFFLWLLKGLYHSPVDEYFMVVEWVARGSLLDYLHKCARENIVLSIERLIEM